MTILGPLLVGVAAALITVTLGQQQTEYGALIGDLRTLAHDVSGTVYAASENTLFIKGFNYDGQGPDAFFWIGSQTAQPSSMGILLEYPDDGKPSDRVLDRFENVDVILRLPDDVKVQDMKWFSVWCRRFHADFGNVIFPAGLAPPKTRTLSPFSTLAHQVSSGEIVIVDTKTFRIPNFRYDGGGPDAFFWVGTGSAPSSTGTKVPDERGSLDVLRGYQGEDIEITLPGDLTVHDIDWLSVWCVSFKHNFGWTSIPADLANIPPHLTQAPQEDTTPITNCRPFMDGKLQVSWGSDADHAYVQLSAKVEENKWMAFGVSGDSSRGQMVGGDVVVTFYDAQDDITPWHADDYRMTAKAQCADDQGVCPDTELGGTNEVEVISGKRSNGVTTITYKRPLRAGDGSDKAIPSSGSVQVITAIGPLNTRKQANYHTDGRDSGVINFSDVNSNECGSLDVGGEPENSEPWPQRRITDVKSLRARIGPTGGLRGYQAITGFPSWGIAWWINGQLIPELVVRRGETYTFTVEGGNDRSNPARYHPLYITDDPEGGYVSKNSTWQERETVYAGVRFPTSGDPEPTAVGHLCEYVHNTTDQKYAVDTFSEYAATLKVECDPDGSAATLEWTVAESTPDTVYYQCYTHRNLGWKIMVLDPDVPIPPTTTTTTTTTTATPARGKGGNGGSASLYGASALLVTAVVATVLGL